MATTRMRESATITQPSRQAVMTGMYQRRGAWFRISHTARAGTAVPMRPTDSSRTKTPTPSCGASMIPPAIRTLAAPSRAVARLLASRTVSTRTSV